MTDAHISDRTAKARRMEEVIRGYFDACNSGDADAVAKYFAPGAVHYFPPDMYDGPFRGGETIGAKWSWAVRTLGSHWTWGGAPWPVPDKDFSRLRAGR